MVAPNRLLSNFLERGPELTTKVAVFNERLRKVLAREPRREILVITL